MPWTNTQDRYGYVHMALHWTIAIAVVAMLVIGLFMGDIDDKMLRFQVYSVHKALGITILALMLARLGWKLANWNRPQRHSNHSRPERIAAAVVHWGFYVLLIAMPLSGWILTSSGGSTVNWFGFFPIPGIAEQNHDLHEAMEEIHEILASVIWVFIGLHVAGALKHAIIDRDGTLRRMVPFAAAALMLAVPAHAAETPTVWTIARDKSTLSFEATQEGSPFSGEFRAFDGTITFDPETPEKGSAAITIDLGSIDTGMGERDQTVKEKDWFDLATTPTASYVVDTFEKGADEGAYIAKGRLLLRGIEKPLDLPFTLRTQETDGVLTAHATGQTTIKRLDFGVGQGSWSNTDAVGDAVIVLVDIVATAKAH